MLADFGTSYPLILGLVAIVVTLKAHNGVRGLIRDPYDIELSPLSFRVRRKGQTMAKRQKTIIPCAATGAIHTPTMSDALPYVCDDIATQAIEAAEDGASILHLNARDNETAAPSVNPDDFTPFLGRIKQATDAVVNISTGGSLTLSVQDRIKTAETFSALICSTPTGSR